MLNDFTIESNHLGVVFTRKISKWISINIKINGPDGNAPPAILSSFWYNVKGTQFERFQNMTVSSFAAVRNHKSSNN